MRAIFIFLILIIFFVSGCAPIEVVKEVTKATQSVETSVKKIFNASKKENEKNNENEEEGEVLKETKENEDTMLAQKKEILKEKKQMNKIIIKQKKIATINILQKSVEELSELLGKPDLIRKDGKTTYLRFDSNNCRLFVFMNSSPKKSYAEYYELRNSNGELIDRHNDIEFCFKEIKSV